MKWLLVERVKGS